MKSLRILALTLLTTMLFSGGFLVNSNAAEIQNTDEEPTYTVDEDVFDDLYVAGEQRVTVNGDVFGDLFVAGGTLKINGFVAGDVYIAGGQVDITNDVDGSVYAGGGQLDVNGTISRSLYAAGGTIEINADIAEDVFITGGQIELSGSVGDDVRAAGGMIVINSTINGDLLAGAGTLEVLGDVLGDVVVSGDEIIMNADMIGGDLKVYGAEDTVTVNDDIDLLGEYQLTEPSRFESDMSLKARPFIGGFSLAGLMWRVTFGLLNAIGIIILGWAMLKVAPVKTEQTLLQMKNGNDMVVSGLVGLLAGPALLIISFFALISVIGWPSLWVLLSLAAIARSLAVPLFALRIGRFIANRIKFSESEVIKLAVGVLVLSLVFAIPCLGFIANVLVLLVAVGAMLRMHYFKYKDAQAHLAKKKK